MVSKNTMATFGQGYVQTQMLSENGAVKYKLSAAGSNSNSEPNSPYLMLNDSPLGSQTFERGLNIRVLDTATNTIVDSKIFDLINAGGAATAFIDYMNGLSSGLIAIIISSDELKTEQRIDDWFVASGSDIWPGKSLLTKFPKTSFVAFYASSEKAIVQEQAIINDGIFVEDSRAKLEIVYDTIGDIGVTGFSRKLIYDPGEYSSSTGYEFKRYPTDDTITSLVGFGGATNPRALLIADMYASKELISSGLICRASLRWFNGQSLISAVNIETPMASSDKYVHFERLVDVPTDATGYTLIVSRYPNTADANGEAKIKNVVLTRVARSDSPMNDNASFGVNGIRMVTANDNGETEYLLELPDTKTDQSGTIYSSDFREFDKSY